MPRAISDHPSEATQLDKRAVAAAFSRGESDLLIADFQPFIYGCVNRYANPTASTRKEDMISVAMVAFYEAIRTYNPAKGHFLPQASRVIRARLVDFLRSEYRSKGMTLPLELERRAEEGGVDALDIVSFKAYAAQEQQELLTIEIEQLKQEMKHYGITFDALLKESPKHAALRRQMRMALQSIAKDFDIVETILIKKYLPVKKIAQLTQLSEKKVKSARTYIMVAILILKNDYPYLSEYLHSKE